MEHHGAGLRRLKVEEQLVEQLKRDPLNAALSEPDSALIAYAAQLTRHPESLQKSDVEALRRAGFDDRAIHDACQVVAYFAYVNRVADGLGVELEERFDDS